MRDNGLSAPTYVAVADLDPTTADVLLAELAGRGVAAYAADSPEPGPSGRVDRLYVDAAAEAEARTMIDEQLAGAAALDAASPGSADALDFDAAFADIVAGFDTPGSAVGRWSAQEDLAPEHEPAAPGTAGPPSRQDGPGYHVGWDDVLRPQTPPESAPAGPAEDRYVPPPPPPLPHASRRTVAAWVAVTAGPAVLFAAAIFGWQLQDVVLLVAVVAFLAGFVTLVAGLKDGSDDDSGDDGAVV